MQNGASAPRRRPAKGGYVRGEETRARIIDAAIRVFGEQGYVRASTRRIAEEAGVKPPALQYYFDSKDGLHLACGDFLLAFAAKKLALALNAANKAVRRAGRAAAVDALCEFLEGVLDAALASENVPERALFMSRVQADAAGPAYPVIRTGLVEPVHDLCTRLVSRALGRTRVDDEIRLRTSIIISQLNAFHLNRARTLSLLGWKNFDGPRRAKVKEVLRLHTQAALTTKTRPRRRVDS